jgi:hypothetical protein
MQPGSSHRDRISEAMRISSRPLDDDQLADRTGISPRQRVNQICRSALVWCGGDPVLTERS